MGLFDIFTGKRQRKEAQRAADYQTNKQKEVIQAQQDAADYASQQRNLGQAMTTGKTNLFDMTDKAAVMDWWKTEAPNINMADPFPSFLRTTGDKILGDIEGAAGMISDFGDRFSEGEGLQRDLAAMQEGAQGTVGQIYSGELEDKFTGYNQDLANLYEGLKGINTSTGGVRGGMLDLLSGTGEDYAQSLGAAHENKAALEGQRFQAERGALEEREGRYGGTRDAQMAGALAQRQAIENAANRGLGGLFGSYAGQGGGSNRNALARMMGADAAQAMVNPVTQANVNYAQKMEGVLPSEVEAEHLRRMMEINPEMADVYVNEAMMNNQMRDLQLGTGMQGLEAQAKNLGYDLQTLDDKRNLNTALMNFQLQNMGQIPGLGQLAEYVQGVPTDLAMAESQALADYAGPFTARGQVSAPQTVYNTNPYTAPMPQQRPSGMEQFMNLMGAYG